MKKLMIAAAIVCAAVVSQAAAFNWKTTNVKDIDGVNKYSGKATITLWTAGTSEVYATLTTDMVDGVINVLVGGNVPAGTKVDAQYTMTDAKGNVFTSTLKKNISATDPANAPINFGYAGTWTAAPVPEPTSGLLLLLGVAGMALKRKRA